MGYVPFCRCASSQYAARTVYALVRSPSVQFRANSSMTGLDTTSHAWRLLWFALKLATQVLETLSASATQTRVTIASSSTRSMSRGLCIDNRAEILLFVAWCTRQITSLSNKNSRTSVTLQEREYVRVYASHPNPLWRTRTKPEDRQATTTIKAIRPNSKETIKCAVCEEKSTSSQGQEKKSRCCRGNRQSKVRSKVVWVRVACEEALSLWRLDVWNVC